MLQDLITNVLAAREALLAGGVIGNRLNPWHLNLAASAYRIQAYTLQIPDRFGFFLPGPPRLQVYQAAMFMILFFMTCVSLILVTAMFSFFCLVRLPNLLQLAFLCYSMPVGLFCRCWILSWGDRTRAPGYEWRTGR